MDLSPFAIALLVLNSVSTWFLVGVSWFVQLVHYPLMNRVESSQFRDWHRMQTRRAGRLVALPMGGEAVTAVLMVWYPPLANPPLVLIGLGLVFLIWMTTVFVLAPCHGELLRGFQPVIHHRLVIVHWFRTVAWTLRGFLVAWFVWSALMNTSMDALMNQR